VSDIDTRLLGKPCKKHAADDHVGFRRRVLGHIKNFSKENQPNPASGFCALCGCKIPAFRLVDAKDTKRSWDVSTEAAAAAGVTMETPEVNDAFRTIKRKKSDGTEMEVYVWSISYCEEACQAYPSDQERLAGAIAEDQQIDSDLRPPPMQKRPPVRKSEPKQVGEHIERTLIDDGRKLPSWHDGGGS
jgi:hypothetical protein